MRRWALLCLLILYGTHGGLSTGLHGEMSARYSPSGIDTNDTATSLQAEQDGLGKAPVSLTGNPVRPQAQTSKAAAYRILYITNRTADSAEHGWAQSNEWSGFKWKSAVDKPPAQTYKRKTTNGKLETARGKNWCAYVHTRLSPTVVIDSATSYLPVATYPCRWSQDGCPERYGVGRHPTYRVKHKIVTSLEWKCCPGYLGHQCQLSNAPTTPVLADESGGQTPGDLMKESTLRWVQQTAAVKEDVAETKKQGEAILTLKKEMANLTEDMKRIRMLAFSSEGKTKTEEQDNVQFATETLKSEEIQKMFREMVQQEIQASQKVMQENFTNIYKIVSAFSRDLTATKANIEQINKRITKLLLSMETHSEKNKQIAHEIQGPKDEVPSVQDVKVIHEKEVTERFQDKFHLVQQKKTSEITESESSDLKGALKGESAAPEGQWNGSKIQIHLMSFLHDAITRQASLIQQLQLQSRNQEMKMGNLSFLMGRERRLADIVLKQNVVPLLEEIYSRIDTVNETLCNRIKPVNIAVNAIEERIGHISYDLEELNEKRQLSGGIQDEGNEISPTKVQPRELVSIVSVLNVSVINLEQTLNELSNQTWKENINVKDKFKEYRDEIEDVVNDTMTVMNKAIDSVKDDYYVLKNNLDSTNEKLSKLCDDFREKFESLNNLKPDIESLNMSVLSMQIKLENTYMASNESNMLLSPDPKARESNTLENLADLSHKLNNAFSKLENHQRAISLLQQANSSFDSGEYAVRLEGLEVRLNALGTNITSVIKPKKKPPLETALAWKFKDLSRRVQNLTAQTLNLSHEVLWLKGSTSHEKQSGKNLSATPDKMQAHISQISQEHIGPAILHQNLSQFMQSKGQALREQLGSNRTINVGSALSSIIQDISLLQTHTQELDKKLEAVLAVNASIPVGRNQRNTDVIIVQEEAAGCHVGRCQNGGTCIDVRSGYVCACRSPFSGTNCTAKLDMSDAPSPDFSKGSYRYIPMVTFFVAHTFAMTAPGPVRFNHLYVNYGASFSPGSGKFAVPYLGVYVFRYTVESSSPELSGYLVVDDEDKLAFQAQESANQRSSTCVATRDAVLELNRGQRVWLRLENGAIPAKYPPVTTFGGYLLYRT